MGDQTWRQYPCEEARFNGRPREIPDGRLILASREAWYDGWDEQDRHMRPTPTAEKIEESRAGLDALRRELGLPPKTRPLGNVGGNVS